MKTIGLYYVMPAKIVGCWKVINNLLKGLKELGYAVNHQQKGDKTGALQRIIAPLPPNTLIGPEIMVLPTEYPQMWTQYKYWVQPSQWCLDYFKQFPQTKHNELFIWPVGIDTEEFNDRDKNITQDVFIYYKNVTKQTPLSKLSIVQEYLKQKKLSYTTFEYGKYDQAIYQKALKTCRAGIFITGTESQGIAYMEALSCGVPLYVLDEKTFLYDSYTFTNNSVSAAPYFDDTCGIKDVGFHRFNEFWGNLSKYTPRKYILDNHTLAKGAEKYVNILNLI